MKTVTTVMCFYVAALLFPPPAGVWLNPLSKPDSFCGVLDRAPGSPITLVVVVHISLFAISFIKGISSHSVVPGAVS